MRTLRFRLLLTLIIYILFLSFSNKLRLFMPGYLYVFLVTTIFLFGGFCLGSFMSEFDDWKLYYKNFSFYKSNPIEKQYYKVVKTHKFKKIGSCHFGPIYKCKNCELLANKYMPILMPFSPYTYKRELLCDDAKVITTTCIEEIAKNVLL